MTLAQGIAWWVNRLRQPDDPEDDLTQAQLNHLVEEVGEAFKEWNLVVKQNPRKDYDVEAEERFMQELCDVIITGMITLCHVDRLWEDRLNTKLNATIVRMQNHDAGYITE